MKILPRAWKSAIFHIVYCVMLLGVLRAACHVGVAVWWGRHRPMGDLGQQRITERRKENKKCKGNKISFNVQDENQFVGEHIER